MSFFSILDARIKFFFILMLTLLVFLTDKLPAAVFLLISFIILRLISKIPLPGLKFLLNLTLLAFFIITLQAIFGPGNSYIVKPFKWEGFFLGLVITCRIAALMIILPVFTETTPPFKISAGLCALGLNYRAAYIITAAFNLIPLFKNEALLIMEAQKLRGLKSYGFRAYAGLLIPLMLCAMRKAQNSSVSMDSRAFGLYKTRTLMDKPEIKAHDIWFLIFCIAFSACFLLYNYL